MTEKRFLQEESTRGICIDMRNFRKQVLIDPDDIEVDIRSYEALLDHISEGLYNLGLKYYGVVRPEDLSEGKRHSGINCIKHSYTNVFIRQPDNFFHVYVLSPQT